jgi:hypothetical protein
VLDANCTRGSPEYELYAIKARGFSLSVSVEGLREVWARSLHERNYDLLASRMRKLGPVVDPADPIAFVGEPLLGQIGVLPADAAARNAAFRQSVADGWHSIQAEGLSVGAWERIGRDLQQELDHDEEWWQTQIDHALEVVRTTKGLATEANVSLDVVRRFHAALKRSLPPSKTFGSRLRRVDERTDAVRSYLAAKLANAAASRPAQNDYQDSRHLTHLAWPAFLVTLDVSLIRAVDASGTFQGSWVRTPIELIEEAVPRCEPWGKPAKWVVGHFRRMPIDELRCRQEQWRRENKPRN